MNPALRIALRANLLSLAVLLLFYGLWLKNHNGVTANDNSAAIWGQLAFPLDAPPASKDCRT